MFDGLVRGPIFAQANRVVGHQVNHRQFHQRGQANRRADVIGKHQKCRRVRPHPAVQGHAIAARAHGVFAHPPGDIALSVIAATQITDPGHETIIGWGEVGTAAHQPRDPGRYFIEHLPRRRAGRHAAVIRGKHRDIGIPARGQIAAEKCIQLSGQLRVGMPVGIEPLVPGRFQLSSARHGLPHMGQSCIRHEKTRFRRPAVKRLGELDLGITQRRAMRIRGILLIGRAIADVRTHDDQ